MTLCKGCFFLVHAYILLSCRGDLPNTETVMDLCQGQQNATFLSGPTSTLRKTPEVKFKITIPDRSIKWPHCVPREVKYSAHSRFSSSEQNSLFHGNASWDVYMTFKKKKFVQQQSTVLGNLSIWIVSGLFLTWTPEKCSFICIAPLWYISIFSLDIETWLN